MDIKKWQTSFENSVFSTDPLKTDCTFSVAATSNSNTRDGPLTLAKLKEICDKIPKVRAPLGKPDECGACHEPMTPRPQQTLRHAPLFPGGSCGPKVAYLCGRCMLVLKRKLKSQPAVKAFPPCSPTSPKA